MVAMTFYPRLSIACLLIPRGPDWKPQRPTPHDSLGTPDLFSLDPQANFSAFASYWVRLEKLWLRLGLTRCSVEEYSSTGILFAWEA